MDQQTSPEIVPNTPSTGEANTAVPAPEPLKTENPTVEPVMNIPPETPTESLPAPEMTTEITPTEPIPEIATAQTAGNEPLTPPRVEETPTTEPEPEAQTQPEPTPTVTQGSTAQETQPTPQGSVQPEPTPEPVPAQAQVIVTRPQGSLPFSGTEDRQENLVAPRNIARLLLEKAKATIQLRKQKKLLKIMTLFEKKNHITNDEVEKFLHVSDATATRYLSELEKQGRILQSGKTGHAVSYTKR